MDYNYHTHTYLCRHAFGTVEEYVARAVENGIKHMGFSEHAPLRFPDGYESEARLYVDNIGEYFDTIRKAAEKYRDKHTISCFVSPLPLGVHDCTKAQYISETGKEFQ